MSKQIQDMVFEIKFEDSVTGVDYRMLTLVNDEGHLIVEHPVAINTVNYLLSLDTDERNKACAAYLAIAFNYTRDYPEGTGAATAEYARSAWVCLEQYVVESGLGEFTDEDFANLTVIDFYEGRAVASITSPNGSEVVITLRRQNGQLWTEHVRHFTDEDTIPTIQELFQEWEDAANSRLQIEPAAVMSFGDVNFVYAVDTSEAARVRREALLQITIGDRLIVEQRIFEGSKPILYFILEVFNMLALRFRIGSVASVNEEDRVTILNAVVGLIGGHLGMSEHVQIEAGMVYAHEGSIDDHVTYAITHELTADNLIKATYRFMRMVDDTMRRSIEMVDQVEYLEYPMTPLEFYNAFQVDISRELGVARRFDIAMIAAIDNASGLGKDNELLFRIKEDMMYFKQSTLHSPVIMGRKTYDSLPNPLVDRLNIVITSQPIKDHTTKSGVVFVNSKEEALSKAVNYLTENGGDKIWIIGGAQIYAMFLPDAAELHLTVIHAEREDADTFFPEFNHNAWDAEVLFDEPQLTSREGEDISYNRFIMRRKA